MSFDEIMEALRTAADEHFAVTGREPSRLELTVAAGRDLLKRGCVPFGEQFHDLLWRRGPWGLEAIPFQGAAVTIVRNGTFGEAAFRFS